MGFECFEAVDPYDVWVFDLFENSEFLAEKVTSDYVAFYGVLDDFDGLLDGARERDGEDLGIGRRANLF